MENSTPTAPDADLWNEDLAPTPPAAQTWDWKAYAALWVSMVACVPTYLLAGGLVSEGMSWAQAVLIVLLGNVIVLVPMLLIGHAGATHRVPFPVLLRASFGTRGANVPALARGLVACGWFGINTWVGGSAIYVILNTLTGTALTGPALPVLGIDAGQTACFLAFWALHLYFIHNGTESIRWLETWSAPFLMAAALALLGWALIEAGGMAETLKMRSAFAPGGAKHGQFWPVFAASLTAMVGFWATMALNMPDFTRFARRARDQWIGQALGLPLPMAAFAFVSVVVTGATITLYGEAIWDPVALAGRMGGWGVVVALLVLIVATLTTNLAANMVSPAYDFSNLAPRRISFRLGGYITAGLGVAMFPWKVMESAGAYLYVWLVGYSALLGPIAGILIVDFYLLRRRRLNVDALFRQDGAYGGTQGWRWQGLTAFALGAAPSAPGFLHAAGALESVPPLFDQLYSYAWFVGVFVGGALYWLFSAATRPARAAAA